MKQFTAADLLAELKASLNGTTQKAVSVQLGFTPQFINDVVHGRREITAELARALGYQRKVHFEKANKS